MASLMFRTVSNVARRTATLTTVRCMGDVPYVNPHKGKVSSDDTKVADELGMAVGPERFELLANLSGNMDPFAMEGLKRRAGTKADPTIIYSQFDRRIVGCLCTDEQMNFKLMWIHKGEQKRCECGFWFKYEPMPMEDFGHER